ncbi:cupin domain-containing protein [Methanotrichaceae archaeon M04Ac]|uniref:Cupin domain-containing protein n=1 Tax=Candidatus Methanocrinis alkalitolerans TaxID=3033395 RepID=A0ABT5XHD3_9EURY|nr:cupin domain-containing protein [Candidatus Methanocrinis alkalitolerans]MCR3884912.1 cupin domain-containing protein [Methanothrix sp.]MDF0594043.1 cupin domain-containing protein [Candidatus Methanocrinis alkalitolerans]
MNPDKDKGSAEDIAGRPLKVAELVDYQEGAVVSRTLVDKRTGTVTLFAFDEGQGLSEHTAPFDAVVNVIEGEAEIVICGEAMMVSGGEMVIMPAGEPHSLSAATPFKMMLTMIRS